MTPDLAINLSHVAKTYSGLFGRGKVQALRGIQMQVRKGEIFGLLGPNGAGKSTLVKILMTVIRPSRCDGTLLDHPVGHKPVLGRVGYLPEHHRFPDYLTGAQVIDFYGAMNGVPRRHRRARAGELLDLVGMSDWARKRVRSYSKGMRQRIGIAQALVNNPEIVLLDEPTDGVDPVGRRDIRNICLRMKEEGRTVFLNSHLLSELEMVCDRVAIMVKGIIASQGTIDELTRGQQHYTIELAEAPAGTLPAQLDHVCVTSGHTLEISGATLKVGTTDAAAIQPLIDELRARHAVIRSIRPHRPSLEDLFMQAVTDPTTGAILTPGADQKRPPRAS
jgi:ABC-2 type transport system ATP-binding protein